MKKHENKKYDEHILVVKRSLLFGQHQTWHGLQPVHTDYFAQKVHQHKEFLPRGEMEKNPDYKQIIPYLIFTHNNKYFVMQRRTDIGEQRLKNKMSFGIGGHIRQEDIQNLDIASWAQREFHEEVNYSGSLTIEPLGILNDDTNAVGQVHIGFVYLLRGDSNEISIKSEFKFGELKTLEECSQHYENMETWSQIVFDHLRTPHQCYSIRQHGCNTQL